MKRILIIIIFLSTFLIGFKEIKVKSILDFLNFMDEAQNIGLVKIKNISFERLNSSIKGYLDFYISQENLEKFKEFLKEKNIYIGEISFNENRVYLREDIKENINFDFKTTFYSNLIEILSSKNFYFILLIALIFYFLILPNL
jgi:methionine synthase II (cobalamin-independent)